MNCLEFRRLCLIDPDTRAAAYVAHAQSCARCARFARGQDEREHVLRAALRVDTPVALAERILLRHAFARDRTPRTRWAVAATLLLGVGVGLFTWHGMRVPTLTDEVLAHVRAEPESLTAGGPADPDKVSGVLRALGVTLDGAIGPVRYAGICDIALRPGGHLVLAGERGPVTLLLLPGSRAAATQRVTDGHFEGLLVPAAHGAFAVVGFPGEPLDGVVERLRLSFAG
jgi:hypothetical protein